MVPDAKSETAVAVPSGLDQLRAELGERHSPRTVKNYLWLARHFFDTVGDKAEYTRQDFLAFYDQLIKQGRGQAYLDMAWAVTKAVCRAKAISFPCREGRKGDRPISKKVAAPKEIRIGDETHEVTGPTPEYKEIAQLVAWVRAKGKPKERAYLALSTIYAMRAIEISMVNRREDIQADRLFVRTAKLGQPKWHRIPPEVSDQIKGFKYPQQREDMVFYTFKRMRAKAGLGSCDALTPHGMRRWLNTYFSNLPNLNPYVWYDFARWRIRRGDMIAHYRHASPQTVDEQIFALHPLLPLWRGEVETQA